MERVRSKRDWNDFALPNLEKAKDRPGITERTDLQAIADVMDLEDGSRA